MKLKLSQLQDSLEGLTGIGSMKLKAQTAFRVSRILKSIEDPLKTLEETRADLLKRVGEEDPEKPGVFKIIDAETWQQEIKALMEQEVEINVQKLKLADFGDAEAEPRWFAPLDWCIEES